MAGHFVQLTVFRVQAQPPGVNTAVRYAPLKSSVQVRKAPSFEGTGNSGRQGACETGRGGRNQPAIWSAEVAGRIGGRVLWMDEIINLDTARQCKDAGANFITAPGFNRAIVEFAGKENFAVLPGGLTPTEVVDARMAGADFVKVFPCELV